MSAGSTTGVTVWVYRWFEFEIRSGYLLLANQHTSSEGQGSRDLGQVSNSRQTLLNLLRLSATAQIFVPTSNIQPFLFPLFANKANVKLVVRKRNVWDDESGI